MLMWLLGCLLGGHSEVSAGSCMSLGLSVVKVSLGPSQDFRSLWVPVSSSELPTFACRST